MRYVPEKIYKLQWQIVFFIHVYMYFQNLATFSLEVKFIPRPFESG